MRDAALAAAIERAAALADELAGARREVATRLRELTRAHQRATGQYGERPPLLRLELFDRELTRLMAGGGFVRPFYVSRPSQADWKDALFTPWKRRRDADSPEAFAARWRKRLADGAPREE